MPPHGLDFIGELDSAEVLPAIVISQSTQSQAQNRYQDAPALIADRDRLEAVNITAWEVLKMTSAKQ